MEMEQHGSPRKAQYWSMVSKKILLLIICSLTNTHPKLIYPQFSFNLDFDIYNFASEAFRDKHYHTAVVFFEVLVKMIMKNKNLEKPTYLKNFKLSGLAAKDLTLEKAKRLYRKTLVIHDKQLAKWGPYGPTSRCNTEPFMSKSKQNVTIPDVAFKPILDCETTFKFIQKWPIERAENGRKNYTTVAKDTKENVMRAFVAPLIQAEKLCNGTQIRV